MTFSKGKPDWPRVFDDDLVWKFTCDGLNSHLLRGHYYLSLRGPNLCQRPLKDHVLIEKFFKWLIDTTLTVWSTSTWFLYAFASVLGNSALVSLAHQKISKCQDDAQNKEFQLYGFYYLIQFWMIYTFLISKGADLTWLDTLIRFAVQEVRRNTHFWCYLFYVQSYIIK